MNFEHILITGGAGFVGSNLAVKLKTNYPHSKVTALDNLYRKGSEKILSRLKEAGVSFIKADVRDRDAMLSLPTFDLLIECSAEPSVKAGYDEDPFYLLDTNLGGAINCAEACRRHSANILFLSSSRVYPINALRQLPLREDATRLSLNTENVTIGYSAQGITSDFTMAGPRSLYGSSKLAAEHLLQEFQHTYGLKAHIVRSGVIAGPWQMGKTDQGFVSLWCAAHLQGKGLSYTGFGGAGKQVRDVLHIDDLYNYVNLILTHEQSFNGNIYQIGGGIKNAVSLLELTRICETITGNKIVFKQIVETHPSDIPYYVADITTAHEEFNWHPKKTVTETAADIVNWLKEHPEFLTN